MKINDTYINADLSDVLGELRRQLANNQIPLLQKMQDSGRNIMVQCPFHGNGQERKPSAGIRKSDGILHCFACGEVHTLPEVVSHCFGWDDMFGQQGMKWLVRNFATVQIEEREDVEIDLARNNIADKDNVLVGGDSDKPQWVSEEELDSYRYYHPYMFERGLKEPIIERFDIGYDKKTDSITFPVRDVYKHTLFIARRSVKYKHFNYPKGVEKPLYGLYELYHNQVSASDDVFLVESMIDCVLLCQEGHKAVAFNGLGSDLQFKQLNDLPVRHFILATDNDSAGQKAADVIANRAKGKLITRIYFPNDVKDVGDLGKAKRFDDIKNIREWEVL